MASSCISLNLHPTPNIDSAIFPKEIFAKSHCGVPTPILKTERDVASSSSGDVNCMLRVYAVCLSVETLVVVFSVLVRSNEILSLSGAYTSHDLLQASARLPIHERMGPLLDNFKWQLGPLSLSCVLLFGSWDSRTMTGICNLPVFWHRLSST